MVLGNKKQLSEAMMWPLKAVLFWCGSHRSSALFDLNLGWLMLGYIVAEVLIARQELAVARNGRPLYHFVLAGLA